MGMDSFNRLGELVMLNDKVIIHSANELWTIASIIKSDFPKLKSLVINLFQLLKGIIVSVLYVVGNNVQGLLMMQL